MDAAIVAIGSELTTGRIVDTNSAWISRRLMTLGVKPVFHIAIPDERKAVIRGLRDAADRARFIVITGGLGPTEDDLTRDAIAEAMGAPLELDPPSLAFIEGLFAKLGRPMSPSNKRQALFPRGARILDNDCGTAPGFSVELYGARLYCMPGVPREMFRMWERHVEPELAREAGLPPGSIAERMLRTCGIAESALGEATADLVRPDDPKEEIAWCVQDGEGTIVLTFTVRDPENPKAAAERADALLRAARERLGKKVCVVGPRTLSEHVLDRLEERKRTLATAESCTGGRVASWITAVPGASASFHEGVVAYANDVKVRRLGVSEALLAEHGAVSEPVARAMAEGVRSASGADYGIGITGIAGPDGGTAEKPVGLVFLALAGPRGTRVVERRFWGDRGRIQIQASATALDMLRLELEEA
ncbi:MAG TPA: competence/damage-inducible protein A [Planctomycetota bacterium]|nr:competence/damage-inducible protein A [Planctomycetota bacterium]